MRGPLALADGAHARLRPLERAQLTGGHWAAKQRLNREVLLPDAPGRLEAAGNFDDLRAAAGQIDKPYRGVVFMDSDVYKWLEALGWELGREPSEELARQADEAIALLESAQREDGYLNSYYQVAKPGERFSNLAWDHELYCAGHLIQAAVAHARGRGDERLLAVARRFADYLGTQFGPGARDATEGHPEIETALVELSRLTGEARYRELAQFLVDARGRETLQPATFGSSYFQDRVPVREQTEVEGHAVRAAYLGAGVTDLYTETGEQALLDAMLAQWEDMVGRKSYVTGGLGAHHMDEAFGDAYELPPDRCYGETCAAIASAMWSWRLLLVTGEARFADSFERTLYNGVLAGLSLDGRGYSYVNPLHVRDDHRDPVERGARRQPWYECACCPPNVMRLLASLHHYLATRDADGIQVHQYATAELGPVRIATQYPWDGRVEVEIVEPGEWTLSLRVPAWSAETRLDGAPATPHDGYLRLRREWQAGDRVVLDLDMRPRLVFAHPRVDAVRGCTAIERGPLVYCVEAADAPNGARVDDLALDPAVSLREVARADLLGGVVAIEAAGVHRPPLEDGWPFGAAGAFANGSSPVTLTAIPYSHWGNRGGGGMRVWVPLSEGGANG